MSEPRRLGIAELCERLAVHRNSVGNWVREGRFPAPHYIAGARRWWLEEVETWEAAATASGFPSSRIDRLNGAGQTESP